MPHKLAEELMIRFVTWYRDMVKTFVTGQSRYVNDIVMGDETWLGYLLCVDRDSKQFASLMLTTHMYLLENVDLQRRN